MASFLLRRLVGFAATLAGASVVVFVVLEVLPGDPARVLLGVDAEPAAVAALRAELGLDRPAAERYVRWAAGVLRGDLGTSWTYRIPARDLIVPRLAVTLPLAGISMLLSVTAALALGLFAAQHHRRLGDTGVMAFAQLGIAVPNAWLGLLLILAFSVGLGWLPSGGFPGWRAGGIGPALLALALPAVALATTHAAMLARIVRAAVLEVSRDDFVRTARAKGLSRRGALARHVLRNSLVPVVEAVVRSLRREPAASRVRLASDDRGNDQHGEERQTGSFDHRSHREHDGARPQDPGSPRHAVRRDAARAAALDHPRSGGQSRGPSRGRIQDRAD